MSTSIREPLQRGDVPVVAATPVPTSWTGSVPLTVVELLLDDEQERSAAKSSATPLGASLEVPLAALEALRPGLAAAAADLLGAARVLWEDRRVGRAATVPMVMVRVPLLEVRQSDSREGRVDLNGQCRALEALPQTRELVTVLDGAPRWKDLALLATISRDKDRAVVETAIAGGPWPFELGGPPCPGEVHRVLRLEVSHAAWRDRRARRLLSLSVVAVEAWPDPRPFRPPVA